MRNIVIGRRCLTPSVSKRKLLHGDVDDNGAGAIKPLLLTLIVSVESFTEAFTNETTHVIECDSRVIKFTLMPDRQDTYLIGYR